MKTRMLVLFLAVFVAAGGFWLYKSNKQSPNKPTKIPLETIKIPDYSGIQVKDVFIKDIRPGKGTLVKDSSNITVNYEGWIYDPAALGNKGKLIFSKEKYKSVSLKMKDDNILMGFKKGLLGMKAGGLRQLVVPEHLAYGDKGLENLVPPKAILLFEIELLNAN